MFIHPFCPEGMKNSLRRGLHEDFGKQYVCLSLSNTFRLLFWHVLAQSLSSGEPRNDLTPHLTGILYRHLA